jgi:hypothetical protein
MQSLVPDDVEDSAPGLADLLAAPEEPIDLRIDLATLREEVSPQLRHLWDLLVEEHWNVSAVARKLGRPRKSLDYWVGRLRQLLKNRDL